MLSPFYKKKEINSVGKAPGKIGCDVSNSDTDLLEEVIRFTLRIPKEILNRVDAHRKKESGMFQETPGFLRS